MGCPACPPMSAGVSVARRSPRTCAAGNRTGRWRILRANRISIISIALRSNFPQRVSRRSGHRFADKDTRQYESPGIMNFGIDRLIAEPSLRAPLAGRRVALLAHPASVTADLTHSLDALAVCGDVKLSAAF